MEKIRLGELEVAGGLSWASLPFDVPEKKGMAEFMAGKGKGSTRGLVVRSAGISVVGYVKPKEKNLKLPSAQALLALANQRTIEETGGLSSGATGEEHNWIVIEKLDGEDDKYWFGAVKNGVPVPSGDILGTKDEVIQEMNHLLDASPNFIVYTKDKDVRFNALASVDVQDKSFSELVAGIPASKAKTNLFNVGALIAIAVILGMFVLIAAWWGYSVWAEKKALEEAQLASAKQAAAQAAQADQEKKGYEQTVRDSMLTSLKLGIDEVSAALSAPSPPATVSAWRDIVYNIDLYQSGWNLKEIACVMDNVGVPSCRVSVDRGAGGVNSLLLSDHPDAVIEDTKAFYVVTGQAPSKRATSFSALGSSSDFTSGIVSQLQMLRPVSIEHDVQASKDIVKDITLPPPPPTLASALPGGTDPNAPAPPLQIQLGAATGMGTIRGNQLWQLTGIADLLDTAGVRVKDVTLNVSPGSLDNVGWVLSFDYFVRTLPQPILPSVPLGETVVTVDLPAEYRAQTAVQAGGVASTSGDSTATADVAAKDAAVGQPVPLNPLPTPQK